MGRYAWVCGCGAGEVGVWIMCARVGGCVVGNFVCECLDGWVWVWLGVDRGGVLY